jgi:tetratricopeptide (TPR) repeat protein
VKPLLSLCAVLLFARPAYGGGEETPFETIAKQGIDHVYNLEFEEADKDFTELIKLRPAHPAGHFFLAMVDWWRILIDLEDESRDEKFLDALDHVIALADSMLERNPNDVEAIFFKGGALGFQGRLKFHRNDYLGAANAGRKALPLVETAFSLDSSNHDILFGTGIYNYYAEVIPNEYPFVKPLLLFVPSGDRSKGLAQLTTAAEKGRYASTEATYFLMQTYYFYERDYAKVLDLARKLTDRYPNNMIFHRYLGRAYAAMANWPMAESVLKDIVARSRRGQRGYTAYIEREATYSLGVTLIALGKLDEALENLYRCDELSRQTDKDEPSGFMAMANLKIGNIYDLQAKRDLAIVQYKKVLGMKDYRESQTQARNLLKVPYAR